MTNTFAFEWFKLSRRWMPRIILVMLLGLIVLAFWGYATRNVGRANLFLPRGWLAALAFCSFFAPFFWPVLGGSWAGNEYGWGSIRSVLTRRPERIVHVLAALAVLVVAVLIGILCIMAVATGASIVVTALTGNPVWTGAIWSAGFAATLGKGILTAWYVSSFYLLLAYCAAVIARSAAVGIGFGIGSTLAEVVLRELLSALGGIWNTIAEHFPFVYSQEMITRVVGSGLISGTNLARVEPNTPSANASLLALAIYGALILAAALFVVRTRDITA
jgi:ABC-2 type transport system permease protein